MQVPRAGLRSLRAGSIRLRVGLTVALLTLAAWNPSATWQKTVFDAVVVLDITQSMNVTDYRLEGRDASRLDYAKAALSRGLLALPCGSRVGWGIFTEYRILLLAAPAEVCANYGDMIGLLDRIDNRMAWANASEIGKGVANAVKAVQALPSKPGLLFISDGHESPPRHRDARSPFEAKSGELRGVLVGVGGDEPRPIPKSDPEGKPLGFWAENEVTQLADDASAGSSQAAPQQARSHEHLSAMHEANLIALARAGDLNYRRLHALEDMQEALTLPELSRRRETPVALGPAFAVAALAVILSIFAGTMLQRISRRSQHGT